MRIARLRIGAESYAGKYGGGALLPVCRGESWLVNGQGFGHNLADAHSGVQRSEGILKNHLHLPALAAEFFIAERQQIQSLELYFAGIRLNEPQKHSRERGFATATLADDGQGFTGRDRESDAIHSGETGTFDGAEYAGVAAIALAKLARFQKVGHRSKSYRCFRARAASFHNQVLRWVDFGGIMPVEKIAFAPNSPADFSVVAALAASFAGTSF